MTVQLNLDKLAGEIDVILRRAVGHTVYSEQTAAFVSLETCDQQTYRGDHKFTVNGRYR